MCVTSFIGDQLRSFRKVSKSGKDIIHRPKARWKRLNIIKRQDKKRLSRHDQGSPIELKIWPLTNFQNKIRKKWIADNEISVARFWNCLKRIGGKKQKFFEIFCNKKRREMLFIYERERLIISSFSNNTRKNGERGITSKKANFKCLVPGFVWHTQS